MPTHNTALKYRENRDGFSSMPAVKTRKASPKSRLVSRASRSSGKPEFPRTNPETMSKGITGKRHR